MCAGINPYSRYRKILRIAFRKNTCANGCHIIGGSELSCKNFMLTTMKRVLLICRSIRSQMSFNKSVLKNLSNFTEKRLCWSLLYLVPTAAVTFIVLGDEIWSPQIHHSKFVARTFSLLARIQF